MTVNLTRMSPRKPSTTSSLNMMELDELMKEYPDWKQQFPEIYQQANPDRYCKMNLNRAYHQKQYVHIILQLLNLCTHLLYVVFNILLYTNNKIVSNKPHHTLSLKRQTIQFIEKYIMNGKTGHIFVLTQPELFCNIW